MKYDIILNNVNYVRYIKFVLLVSYKRLRRQYILKHKYFTDKTNKFFSYLLVYTWYI